MVKIVTGNINSLKSTRLKSYYEANPIGDGFIALKTMHGNNVDHYDLYRLSTQETRRYIIRSEDVTDEVIYDKIGPYAMLENGYKYLEETIHYLIENHITPIYLDEISLLELEDKGLASILRELLILQVDICVVIRDDLLDRVLDHFLIKDYEIIGD